MNLKFNIFFSIFMIGLGLTSCVDENIIPNNSTTQGDTQYFVKLRLKTQSENFTRAGESDDKFVDGTHDEHAISPNAGNIALFFDDEDNYISYSNLYSVNETAAGTEKDKPWMPEATYSCRFYGFANRQPAKVLVVVNANNNTTDGVSDIYSQLANFPGWTLDEVMKQIWEEKGDLKYNTKNGTYYYEKDPMGRLGFYKETVNGEEVKYFTMTNSTYMEEKAGYELHCAESIAGHFTTDEKELEKLTPVTVYLERMLSKFTLENISFNYQRYTPVGAVPLDVCEYKQDNEIPVYKDVNWAIQILGWGMNGIETQNYIFKNVPYKELSNSNGEKIVTCDWLENRPLWNNASAKRCYWAEDPHYIKDESEEGAVVYPWQFDFAKDKYDKDKTKESYYEHFNSFDGTTLNPGNKSFALTYYPFTTICPNVNSDGSVSKEFSRTSDPFYTPENTFTPGMTVDRSRGSRAYELAGTHMLLGARLLIDESGGNNFKEYRGHIYRNRVGVVYLDEVSMFLDFMNSINQKLASQRYMYYKYYPWNDGHNDISPFHKDQEDSDFGHDMRALVGGHYALYFQNPKDQNYEDYHELTSELLHDLDRNSKYTLVREADALNADGKVIPWIMYNGEPCQLLILKESGKAIIPKTEDISELKLDFEHRIVKKGDNSSSDPDDDSQYLDDDSKNPDDDSKYWKKFGENGRDENDIQSLFFEIWGVADDFNKGLMYYAVPIYAPYEGKAVKGAENLDSSHNPEFTDKEELYYYYGIVRNNWYKFNLHSISDIGIPVSNPNKPIVPNYTNKKSQTKVDMEILQWHIEDQTVVMP